MTTIEVKNDELLGRTNDGVIAVKFYAMQKQIDDLQQENKKLKENWATRTKSYNKVVLKNADLQQENKQLKSILTELEEWVKNDTLDFETTFYMGRAVNYKFILDKIQELKEKYKC